MHLPLPLSVFAMCVTCAMCASCVGWQSAGVMPREGARPPSVAQLPPQGFVLLEPTSTIHVAPDEASDHARYYPSMARGLKDADEPFPVFRLVSVDREQQWATVQTTWNDERLCTDGLRAFANFDLRFFVRVSDLATMTTHEARIVYPDDTTVTLTAGVPLLLVDGRLNAYSNGFLFPAPVAEEARGFAYEPSPHFATLGEIARLNDTSHPGVSFAGVTHQTMPLPRFPGEEPAIFARRPRGDRQLVTLRTHCAEYEVLVSNAAIDEQIDALGSLFGSESADAGTKVVHVDQGARVYSRNGELLGVTRGAGEIFEAEAGSVGGRRCFHYPLRPGDDADAIDLCFTDTDLRSP